MRARSLALVLVVACAGACDRGDGRDSLFETEPASTTTLALTTSTSTTAAGATAGPASVVLRTDGLGIVAFGRPAQVAEENLTSVLGPPEERLGPFAPAANSVWGVCPGDSVRGLRWGRLTVLLTTGATDVSDGSAGEHLSAFWYGWPALSDDVTHPVLHTDEGVTIGSTVTQVRAAHGERVGVFEDDLVGPAFEVGEIDEYPRRLFGALTGTGEDGTVRNIGGGVLCGE